MLLLNIALFALSALPTSLAKNPRHHRTHPSSTLPTFPPLTTATNTTTNATVSISLPPPTTSISISISIPSTNSRCPTVTKTVAKTAGICPDIRCRPILVGGTTPVVTSTFAVGCGCPSATPTEVLSQCDTGCVVQTEWRYETAGGC